MKKVVLFILMLCSGLGMVAQTLYRAVINDPDGYTNVRDQQSSNSDIVLRISKDEVFFVQKGKGNWWPVYLYKDGSKEGYIHSSRVKIINDSQMRSTPLNAADDAAVRGVVGELMQKAVEANNACFRKLKEDEYVPNLSDEEIIRYCSSSMNALWEKYCKLAEADENGTITDDELAAYIGGDSNHTLIYYLLHNGDPDVCEWDEITNILKWNIKSISKTSQGADVTVSIYQESCYEGAKSHTYLSKLKLIKEGGKWKFSDLNCYVEDEGPILNDLYKLLK